MSITIPALIALVMGIAEAAKRAGLNPKYVPLLNVALGLAAGLIYALLLPELQPSYIIDGAMVGLSASGLYSGVKNVSQGVRHKKSNDV